MNRNGFMWHWVVSWLYAASVIGIVWVILALAGR